MLAFRGDANVTKRERSEQIDVYRRRRASDRARERASRAAYLGDRAGLLIATGEVVSLMVSRAGAAAPGRRFG
jgi:hypothetical protein